MDCTNIFFAGVFIGCAVMGGALGIAGHFDHVASNAAAIAHHAAHYDSQTGAFTWNDEEKKP